MRRLRLLLCDDEPLILTWLRSALEPEFSVVGTAEDGASLVAAAHALRPDVIVTEIDLPWLNGIAAAQELRPTLPACRVIFHTSRREPEVMAAAFVSGAVGYLIKGEAPSPGDAIRAVIDHVRDQDEAWCKAGSTGPALHRYRLGRR